MKVLLVQADGKLPNLALMKLSSWHKAHGDQVGFAIPDPERVYVSVVFKKNRENARGIRRMYPDAEVFFGGPGYDLEAELPKEAEFIRPDYSIYPKMDFSMGFTTRGCIRNCYFCIVPEKEGILTRWQHPKEFHNPAFKKIMLLDNNWLADKDWFMETSQWVIDQDLALREGGMDIRLVDGEIARRLSQMKWYYPLHFAFDDDSNIEDVRKGLETLRSYIDVRHKVEFFVYVDQPNQHESGLERCRQLKRWGTNAFVMYNIDRKPTEEINRLRWWANRKWAFWSFDYDEIDRRKGAMT